MKTIEFHVYFTIDDTYLRPHPSVYPLHIEYSCCSPKALYPNIVL